MMIPHKLDNFMEFRKNIFGRKINDYMLHIYNYLKEKIFLKIIVDNSLLFIHHIDKVST